MALKAGHQGIKNTLKLALEKLVADTAGMKIIKTIGDGLQLTDAGKLNVKPATDTTIGGIKVGDGLSIDDGVLSFDGTGVSDYSTEEVDTGVKWIDGKPIYRKTYFKDSSIPASNTSFDVISDFDKLIDYSGGVKIGSNILSISFKASASGCFPQIMSGGNVTLSYSGTITEFNLTLYYTKTVTEQEG